MFASPSCMVFETFTRLDLGVGSGVRGQCVGRLTSADTADEAESEAVVWWERFPKTELRVSLVEDMIMAESDARPRMWLRTRKKRDRGERLYGLGRS